MRVPSTVKYNIVQYSIGCGYLVTVAASPSTASSEDRRARSEVTDPPSRKVRIWLQQRTNSVGRYIEKEYLLYYINKVDFIPKFYL